MSVEAAKKVLELILVKHELLDPNWLTGFADNLIAQIEHFGSFFAQGAADPERQGKMAQAAEFFHEKLVHFT